MTNNIMKPKEKHWKWLDGLRAGLVELFFSPGALCPVCFQEKSLRSGLGENCLNQIMRISPPLCAKCGRPLRLRSVNRRFCEQCDNVQFYFGTARAVALYDGALRQYLTELKYRYRPELGEALGELLVDWVRENRNFFTADFLVPIPIHLQKLAARGYNQTELLASPLGKYFGKKILTDVLIREKFTKSQNSLKREERFFNLRDAFRVVRTGAVSGKRILLIDDIFTTGATVSEAARTLLKAGATNVDVLTLATGVMETEWLLEK
jgi:competence protein ComFC